MPILFIESILNYLTANELVLKLIYFLAIILIFVVIDRIILIRMKRTALKLGVSYDVVRGVVVVSRFILFIIAILMISTLGVIPPEYFVGAGALIGTAIGFSLTNTVSNLISGVYILLSGLFRIGDYIKIGSEEGIVSDMTVNYTKIKKSDGTYAVFSNSSLLGKSVVTYKVEERGETYYVYPIYVSVSNDVPIERIEEAYKEIKEKLNGKVDSVEFAYKNVTRLETQFVITIKVKDAEKIFEAYTIIMGILAPKLR